MDLNNMKSRFSQNQQQTQFPTKSQSSLRTKNLPPASRINTSSHHGGQLNQADEEEERAYERRRQEELRRQIQLKEQELNNMSKTNERLKMRIDRNIDPKPDGGYGDHNPNYGESSKTTQKYGAGGPTSGYHDRMSADPFKQQPQTRQSPAQGLRIRDRSKEPYNPSTSTQALPRYIHGKSSPLRDRSRSKSKSKERPMTAYHPTSSHAVDTQQPRYNNYLNTKDQNQSETINSQYPRHIGVSNANLNTNPSRPDITSSQEQHKFDQPIRDQINAIQGDNNSLQRRLHLVQQELDKVRGERQQLLAKLDRQEAENYQVQKQIDHEDDVDRENRVFQEDLMTQKERNDQLKHQLKMIEQDKNDMVDKVERAQLQTRQTEDQADQAQKTINHKEQNLKMLADDQVMLRQKQANLADQIQNLKRSEAANDIEAGDMEHKIKGLMRERADLMDKLDNLNVIYDDCVRDITAERKQMDSHNVRQTKLVVAKIIFQDLEIFQRRRKNDALNEFVNYCQFDQRCHIKLKNLAKALDMLGKYQQRHFLKRWYQKSLKPMEAIAQSEDLVYKISGEKMIAKYYYMWRKAYLRRTQSCLGQSKALQAMLKIIKKDRKAELMRAFFIWRDKNALFKEKQNKIKKRIYRLYNNKLSQAFNRWKGWSDELEWQCRMQLLAKELATRQWKTHIYHDHKIRAMDMKRRKLNRKFLYWKAWKDYIKKKKFQTDSNVATLKFAKCNQEMLIKQIFDALKVHKEQMKFEIMEDCMENEMKPEIESLNKDVDAKRKKADRSGRQKGSKVVKDMLYARIATYFFHWKNNKDDYHNKMRTTVKQKIIRVYKNQLRRAFDLWRKHGDNKKQVQQEMQIMEMQEDGANMQAEVEDLSKQIQKEQRKVDRCARKSTNKVLDKLLLRFQKRAFDRWREVMERKNLDEEAAAFVIKRMRKRLVKSAWENYKAKVKMMRQDDKNENTLAYLKQTLNMRLMRKTFNAMCAYKNKLQRGHKYFNRIFNRFERNQLHDFFKTWKDHSHQKYEYELNEKINARVSHIDDLHQLQGALNDQQLEDAKDLKHQNDHLTRQARRILSTYFARGYGNDTTRGFEQWKDYTRFMRRREYLMRKSLEHMKKYHFNMFKAAIRNHCYQQKIGENGDQLAYAEMQFDDMNQQETFNDTQFKKNAERHRQAVQSLRQHQDVAGDKLNKLIGMIVRRNDDNVFASKKRYILLCWRQHVKRQKFFCMTVKKVIEKSCWQAGVDAIRETARAERSGTKVQRTANAMRVRFWKNWCGSAFSKWRAGNHSEVTMQFQMAMESNNQMLQEHNDFKNRIINKNNDRSSRLLKTKNLKELFNGWKTVSAFLKLQKDKTMTLDEKMQFLARRRAIKKWQWRTDATQCQRTRHERLREKVRRIRLRMYFDAIVQHNKIHSNLSNNLNYMATMFDDKHKKEAFDSIRSFARSKNLAYHNRKQQSAKDSFSILQNLLDHKMRQYLRHMHIQTMTKNEFLSHQINVIQTQAAKRMRDAFLKWKNQATLATNSLENNEAGPLTEVIFDQDQQTKNLVQFMKEEGFPDSKIADMIKKANEKNKEQMLKSVRRLQHYTKDLYPKPMAFDRWKEYVALRKLMKHWLHFVMKRGKPGQADIAKAFDRWRQKDNIEFDKLDKLPRAQLEKIALNAGKKLGQQSDRNDFNEQVLGHLNRQRDELLDNYTRGKLLALHLCRHQYFKNIRHYFNRYKRNCHYDKRGEREKNLRRNVELITALKDKLRELENDNDNLANENEELRQYSLDGYQIAKNVQNLTAEREKLSVDLADKAQTIKKLLEENQYLTQKLQQARHETELMVNKSHKTQNQLNSISGF